MNRRFIVLVLITFLNGADSVMEAVQQFGIMEGIRR
jgi:hypothetical protein